MISVLIEGTLVADPVERISARGQAFVTASVRAPSSEGDEAVLCSVITFSTEAGAALAALQKGDSVAISGHAGLRSWTSREGETRTGLSITASRVLSVYAAGQRRRAAQGSSHEQQPAPDGT